MPKTKLPKTKPWDSQFPQNIPLKLTVGYIAPKPGEAWSTQPTTTLVKPRKK